jgi:oligopeptide/dipeptide ABC transporter ATP-binding protein
VSEPLVEATGVSLAYGRHGPTVVRDVELRVEPGVSIGIVGESGCGKTSLARLLVGAIEPTAGTVRVGGRPYREIRRGDPLRRSVQLVFQDPYASLNPGQTARQTVAEVFQVWEGLSRREARARAGEALAEVGLSGDACDRRPGQLSGGQCQRVGIARALACQPALIVADEPTSSLDVSVQAQILNLLVGLRERRGLALVLVSHDLSVIRYLTDETLVMYRGSVVERGPTEEIFSSPDHPYTRLLLDSIPGGPDDVPVAVNAVAADPACPFAPRCPRMRPHCVTDDPPHVRDGARTVACHHPLTAISETHA